MLKPQETPATENVTGATANLTLLQTALILQTQGYSVLPLKAGSKSPAVPWKQYQQNPAPSETIQAWYSNPVNIGIGVICGQASRNLEMLEVEGRATDLFTKGDIEQVFTARGLEELYLKVFVSSPWIEYTPSGGRHWYYRVEGTPVLGNVKLAKDEAGNVTIETRGEGGFSVIAPTPKEVHPAKPETGWEIITGEQMPWVYIPTLTAEEYQQVHDTLRTLDQTKKPETKAFKPASASPPPSVKPDSSIWEIRPGDDFEAKTTWEQILEPHGWQKHSQHGAETFWTRPGKNPRDGHSASTGHAGDRDRLYVWSSSTPFTPETPHTKFMAYTILNHNGDTSKARTDLEAEGYGKRRPGAKLDSYIQTMNAIIDLTPPATVPQSSTPDHTTCEPQTPITWPDMTERKISQLIRSSKPMEDYRYIPDLKTWAHWAETKWEIGEKALTALTRYIMAFVENMPCENESDRKKRDRFSGIKKAETFEKRLRAEHTHIDLKDFDTDPYTLNTPTGLIDLRTGITRTASASDYVRKQTTVPAETINTPVWDKFLHETFQDPKLLEWVHVFAGYTTTGLSVEQIFPYMYGVGANGKSVFLEVLNYVLGDYGKTVNQNLLLVTGTDKDKETIRMELMGLRLAVVAELPTGRRLSEGDIKELTGGNTIQARALYSTPLTFPPTHTLWTAGNYLLSPEKGGHGFWRRMYPIPMTYVVPEDQRDPHLIDKLKKEAPGILQWVINGARTYLQNGLPQTPNCIKRLRDSYKMTEDHLAKYIPETYKEVSSSAPSLKFSDIWEDYTQWCETNEIDNNQVSKQKLRKEIEAQFQKARKFNSVGNVVMIAGIAFRNTPEIDI